MDRFLVPRAPAKGAQIPEKSERSKRSRTTVVSDELAEEDTSASRKHAKELQRAMNFITSSI